MFDDNKRKRAPNRNIYRSLRQYKDLSDEEFEEEYSRIISGIKKDEIVEEKFNRLMAQFQEEYDLSEMLPNDRVVLKNLINAMIQLNDYDAMVTRLSREGVDTNITVVEKLSNICKTLRNDISQMQTDLKITRRTRKSEKEQSLIAYHEELKKKAAQFYEQKMHYIFCENCGTLLATVWWLYPNNKTEKITVHCHRELEDGKVCNFRKEYNAKEIMEMGGSNKLENMPESLR